MQLSHALTIAEWVRGELAPACEEIVIGGSVRRRAPYPNDLELVCIPKRAPAPTFGKPLPREPLADKLDVLCMGAGLIRGDKNGDRYKNFYARVAGAGTMKLDLFICRPPMQWGWLLVLRTGPAEFTHWLVTKQSQGGACPDDMTFYDGQLLRGKPNDWTLIPTPTEESVFAALGLAYRPPHQRLARWKGKAPA